MPRTRSLDVARRTPELAPQRSAQPLACLIAPRTATRLARRGLGLLCVAALLWPAPTRAQGAVGAATPAARAALRELDPSDLAFWKNIRNAATSFDGRWFAYLLAPNEGDAEVVIRPTAAGGKEWRFPVGEPPEAAGPFGAQGEPPLAISGDGRWAVFTNYPKSAEARKLRKERKPLQNGATLVNLATGERRDFDKVRRAVFASERPNWLVMQRYNAEGANSAEMMLLDLRSGTLSTVGAVGEFALDESGTWLAWTSETKDLVGSGVQLRNLATDVVR
ncbi:MAG: hypothetical protein ACLGIK_09025, partial [Gemmatimonadota bacterium]